MKTKRLVTAALFLAVGMVLPLLTGQLKQLGNALLPMHLPVMLCGFVCSPLLGGAVGLLLPFLRSAVFGMPPFYPNCIWMALELATYGLTAGLLYRHCLKKQLFWCYLSLIISMLAGRVVWGIAKALLLGVGQDAFTLSAFISGGFLTALPGIILQLIVIPPLVRALDKRLSL